MRFHRFLRTILPGLAVVALGACNEEQDFGLDDWTAEVDTVTLYTASFEEYQGLPSAYDIRFTTPVRVEDADVTGDWDFVVTGGGTEPLALTPIGVFFDVTNNAGFHVSDETFEEIDNAPAADDAYVTDESTPVELGAVYIVRTRTGGCLVFAKLEPLEVNQAEGTLEFRLTRNPNCNDTALVPPED